MMNLAANNEMKTLVLHPDDRSTDFLTPIYEGLSDITVMTSGNESQVVMAMTEHDRVFMLGHGGPDGLFWRGFPVINKDFGPLIASRPEQGLYIWCNADAYSVKHKLTGLVSGMFVSEWGEAHIFGLDTSWTKIRESNSCFSRILRETIDHRGMCNLHKVARLYKHESSLRNNIVGFFNSERLYTFEKGHPDPELHRTSAVNSILRSHEIRDVHPQGNEDALSGLPSKSSESLRRSAARRRV